MPTASPADVVVSADGAMWRADLPTVTVASRGHLRARVHASAAPPRTCIPAATAAARRTRCTRWPRLVASLHDADGPGRRRPASTMACCAPDPALRDGDPPWPSTSMRYYAGIGAGRPAWIDGRRRAARAAMARADARAERALGRLSGPGHEDRDPRRGARQDHLPPRSRPGAAQCDAAIVAHLRRAARPASRSRSRAAPSHATRAYAIDPANPALAAAEAVLEELYGRPPLRVAMGATLPIAELFQRVLGLDTVFFSFATADEDYHAPNEFFRLERFRDGLIAWTWLLARLGCLVTPSASA